VATASLSVPTFNDPQPASRKYSVASCSNCSTSSSSGLALVRSASQLWNDANIASPPA
jgi:hypothetical protein